MAEITKTRLTVTGADKKPITYTTPMITVIPTPGVTIQLPAGPTYIIYASIYGGRNSNLLSPPLLPLVPGGPSSYASPITSPIDTATPKATCKAIVETLQDLMPTRSNDWSYFIQTVTKSVPPIGQSAYVPLPQVLVDFLKQNPRIQHIFHDADIATCTQSSFTTTKTTTISSSSLLLSSDAVATSLATFSPLPIFSTFTNPHTASYGPSPAPEPSTYIRTTYQSTSTHITVRGCLRCDTSLMESIKSYQPSPVTNHQTSYSDQSLTVGDKIYPVHPVRPSGSDQPKHVYQGFVIGSQTITRGQTITIDNVPVAIPESGDGANIIVGSHTYQISPEVPSIVSIGDMVLKMTVRDGTTEYVLGPGATFKAGEMVTVSGSTYSLDALGTVLLVNGMTSTISSIPASNSATTTLSIYPSGYGESGGSTTAATGSPSKGGESSVKLGSLEKWAGGVVVSLVSGILFLL